MMNSGTIVWKRNKSRAYYGVHNGDIRFVIRPAFMTNTVNLTDMLASLDRADYPDVKSAIEYAEKTINGEN